MIIFSIFLYGCTYQLGDKTGLVPDYLVFKTVNVDYSNYVWGTRSTRGDDEWFWGELDGRSPLNKTLVPLNKGYYLRVGVYSDKIAFFEKSFSQSGWRKVPEDETLRSERESLIIKKPFTELFVCKETLFDEDYIKGELGLYGEDYINYIKTQINKMIDEGTLPQNCERKI